MNRIKKSIFSLLLLGIGIIVPCSINAQAPVSDKKWMEDREWAHGFKINPHASTDAAEFHRQYVKNRDLYDTMFRYLAKCNLDTMSAGTYDIVPGRLWMTISEYTPRVSENVKVEGHRKFVDLQYTLEGNESMGVGHDLPEKIAYNDKRDVEFFEPVNIKYHKTTPDTFFLFFPKDSHQPSVRGEGEPVKSRKVVCKIEYLD